MVNFDMASWAIVCKRQSLFSSRSKHHFPSAATVFGFQLTNFYTLLLHIFRLSPVLAGSIRGRSVK